MPSSSYISQIFLAVDSLRIPDAISFFSNSKTESIDHPNIKQQLKREIKALQKEINELEFIVKDKPTLQAELEETLKTVKDLKSKLAPTTVLAKAQFKVGKALGLQEDSQELIQAKKERDELNDKVESLKIKEGELTQKKSLLANNLKTLDLINNIIDKKKRNR